TNFNFFVRGGGQVRSANFVFVGIEDGLGGIRSTGGEDRRRWHGGVFWLGRLRRRVRSADFVFVGIDDGLGGVRSTGGEDRRCWHGGVFWFVSLRCWVRSADFVFP